MKPFSLTYVRYPGGDPLGVAMALASLAPFCVIVATFGAFFARRELWDVGTLLGILANEILAQTLKRVFQQPRPVSCALVDFCETRGMPSSHAQLAWFAAAVAILAYRRRLDAHPASARVLDAFGALLALRTSRWRSRSPRARVLGYHSAEQVAAGAAVGAAAGRRGLRRWSPRRARSHRGNPGHGRRSPGRSWACATRRWWRTRRRWRGSTLPRRRSRPRGRAGKAREASAADDSPFTLSYVKVAMIYTTIIILYAIGLYIHRRIGFVTYHVSRVVAPWRRNRRRGRVSFLLRVEHGDALHFFVPEALVHPRVPLTRCLQVTGQPVFVRHRAHRAHQQRAQLLPLGLRRPP